MSNFDSDSSADNDWEDRRELAWNEFDWERYLREQDEAVLRYLSFYEACQGSPDRIDTVAEKMNWGRDEWSDDAGEEEEEASDDDSADFEQDEEVYTLHKNPIFIATKAIYLGLNRSWQTLAPDPAKVPQSMAVALLTSLQQGEEQAVQAIHALDFGDYAMAVSLFKRALSGLNVSLALLSGPQVTQHPHVLAWREEALPRIFDLREIWLRVIGECRDELERPLDDES